MQKNYFMTAEEAWKNWQCIKQICSPDLKPARPAGVVPQLVKSVTSSRIGALRNCSASVVGTQFALFSIKYVEDAGPPVRFMITTVEAQELAFHLSHLISEAFFLPSFANTAEHY